MDNIKIIRTDSDNPDFRRLIKMLDDELKITNGDKHDFFARYNTPESIKHAVVLFTGDIPASSGGIKEFCSDTAEVKRMYTRPEFRGRGHGKKVLAELENWAKELNFKHLILETALSLQPAVNLYTNYGFEVIPNYGQYEKVETSVCFKKAINK